MSATPPSGPALPSIPGAAAPSSYVRLAPSTMLDFTASERAVGGKKVSISKIFRPAKTGVAAQTAEFALDLHRKRKQARLRGDEALEITDKDLGRGVSSLIERGMILSKGSDVVDRQFLRGSHGGSGSAPAGTTSSSSTFLLSGTAPMHKHTDQFKRQDVLTANLGFASIMAVKLDMAEIEKLPAKAAPERVIAPAAPATTVIPASIAVPEKDKAGNLPPNKEREDARTYAELLDLYSLHEFIIRKGITLRNTPEFVSYKRSYKTQWGAIEGVVKLLEELLEAYGVPLAYVDGKRVAQLAVVDLGVPTREELLSCLANRQDVEPQMQSVIQTFRQGIAGHHKAATKLQSIWRMFVKRRDLRHLVAATRAAEIIQRQWGVHQAHVKTRRAIAILQDGLLVRWRSTMDAFVQNWPTIKHNKRVVIHMPSVSYPVFHSKHIPFYPCFQAAQMPRLADLADPNVDVILIAPFKLESEAFQYYINTIKACCPGAPNIEGRVSLLVPEHAKRLPPTLSLTKLVLMSTKLTKCLVNMVRGRVAYIVAGILGPDEHVLAAKLNLPLMAPDPKMASVLCTKSGGKSILEAADIATPIGAYHIRSTKDLIALLAKLLAEYRDVGRWLIKIDTEGSSRGHAFLDASKVKHVAERGADDPIYVEQVLAELRETIARKVKMVNTLSYPDWQAFSSMFDHVGGCVEAVPAKIIASPTANLYIEPDGTVHLNSIQEQVFSPPLSVLGCIFPQTSTPHEAIRDAALAVAAACVRRRIIGYVSIDFVVYERIDPSTGERMLRLWAVDLDVYLTNNAAIHTYVSLISGASYDPDSGACRRVLPPRTDELDAKDGGPLVYVYSGLIYNPYVGAIRHSAFFSGCRQRGLSFDIQTRTGVAFHLVDVLLKGIFGAICIATHPQQAVQWLYEVQQVVLAELPKDADNVAESNFAYFVMGVKNMMGKVGAERTKKRHQSLSQGSY